MSDTAHHNDDCTCLSCHVATLRELRAHREEAEVLGASLTAQGLAELEAEGERLLRERARELLGADEPQPLPEALRPAYAAAVTAGLAKPLKGSP